MPPLDDLHRSFAGRLAQDLPERRSAVRVDNARRFLANQPLRNVVYKAAWY